MFVLKGQAPNPAPGPFWGCFDGFEACGSFLLLGLLFSKANGVRREAAEYRCGNRAVRKPCLLFCCALADSALKEEQITTPKD